ncbi:acyl-CoA thioesterase domain-containing protein [Nocardia cyriacigeorgica]|uniref:Thioesterase family protein n=1 Tax=Nocardia cyriacigeorgica TaxID=135487 RepID=A0A4U8W2C2_9NOCA|nr:acyl-CoA thioesterase domain-containing protein [Nocardia cyriacigeorgica]VFB00167.1 Uncharacterised protein [Nocardia cyriacigeorgica]
MISFFSSDGDLLVPEKLAVSRWSPNQIGGTGVCGALGRQLETHCPAGFVPARMTADLFRPVLNEPLAVHSEVVREGKRILVADAHIVQNDEVRARATAVFLTTGSEPPGQVWSQDLDLPVPQRRLSPEGERGMFKSGDREWSQDIAANQNADRKVSWHSLPPLVAGEELTPFQRAAILGDSTNHVCHWGSDGQGYINADMTLTLARLPIGHELGLRADNTIASAGISVGSATLYDRTGPVGTCVVTALANAHRQIDFTAPR